MLSRQYRFHGHNSLNWAYRQGKTVRDPRISLRYAKNSKRKNFRAAVVVGRKVSKSAITRNQIRRRIYEVLRPNTKKINGSYDLIFSVYSDEVAAMSMDELAKLINSELKAAGVINHQG